MGRSNTSQFTPINFEKNLRSELWTLKQTDSFEKYAKRFQFIVNQLENEINEEDKTLAFIQGLKPKTQAELNIRKINNFDEAMIIASNYEAVREKKMTSINYFKAGSNTSFQGNNKGTNIKC